VLRLRDGDQDATALAEYTYTTVSGSYESFGWTQLAEGGDLPPLIGTPSGSQVTVEWGFEGAGWVGAIATHVDELSLVQQLCNDPRPDVDGDGDVDHGDFAVIQQCYKGIGGGIPTDPVDCACLDLDGADPPDIDQADLTLFEGCASGPGVPAEPTCDDIP
jgi:hypothetical protein